MVTNSNLILKTMAGAALAIAMVATAQTPAPPAPAPASAISAAQPPLAPTTFSRRRVGLPRRLRCRPWALVRAVPVFAL